MFVGVEGVRDPEILKRLYDLGEVRLREMDEAGIDVQILSHGPATARGSSITRTSSVRGCVSMSVSGPLPGSRRGNTATM